MISVKVYFIVISTISMVNGSKFDEVSMTQPTSHSSYSKCNKAIASKRTKYNNDRVQKRKNDNFSYSYKNIKCSSKTIKSGSSFKITDLIKF